MRAVFATLRNAVAEVAANPKALVAHMTVMAVNDIVWVIFWVLFFRRVGTLRGWDRDLVLLLLAVLSTAGGLSLGFLANARWIGRMAVDGNLDAVLALPVPPLAYILVRRVEPTNIGDVAFGVLLFAFTGSPTLARTAVFVGVVIAAATLLTAFFVLTGSLGFFLGRNEAAELAVHVMLVLGAYPVDVFAGGTKLLLYTVIPAVFVSAVPARLIHSFSAGPAAALGLVAVAFALAAWATFTAGLRRYTSGSVWTQA